MHPVLETVWQEEVFCHWKVFVNIHHSMGQVSLKEEFEVRKRKVENAPACISCLLDPAQTPSPCSRRISYGIILSGNNICGESIKLRDIGVKVDVKRKVTCCVSVGGRGCTRRAHWCRPLSPLSNSRRRGKHRAKPLEASTPTFKKLHTDHLDENHHLWPLSTVFQGEVNSGSMWSSVPVFLVRKQCQCRCECFNVTLRILLVACNDPLVVCEDACFVKLVHTLERSWSGVVVKEVKFVRGQPDSSFPACLRVHTTSQLVKDAQGPVPPDYFLGFKGFKTSWFDGLLVTWIIDPLRLSSSGTLNLLPSLCFRSSQSQRQALLPSPTFSKFSSVHSAF